jgi:DNA polymerase I-like protein with 3'-5' exonuclease and polymerase domains
MSREALVDPQFELFDSPDNSLQLAKRLGQVFGDYKGPIGLDTETYGLDVINDWVRLIQVATPERALVIDLNAWRTASGRQVNWEDVGLQRLKTLLETPHVPKVLHNAAFDLNMLRAEGVVVQGPIFDTMIASKIITNGTDHKNDLGSVVTRTLKVDMPKELQRSDWSGEITGEMLTYAARDAIAEPLLVSPYTKKLQQSLVASSVSLFDVFALEMQALRPITYMRWHGFKFNKEGAVKALAQLQLEADRLKEEFLVALDGQLQLHNPGAPDKWLPREPDGSLNLRKTNVGRGKNKLLAGFNPGSTQQMTRALTDAGIILPPAPPKKGKAPEPGKVSLDQNLLAFLRSSYPLIDQYLCWTKADTRVSCIQTLLKAAKGTDRLHCSYNQMGTATGRLSASEPNLQQVPREAIFRSLFIASPGYKLICADFSQVELRVAAELSGEERMIQAYKDGRDLHVETAALIAKVEFDQVTKAMRTSAKIANFGLLYGAGPATFQKQALAQYGILYSMPECKDIVEGFRQAYPRLYEWQQEEGQSRSTAVFTRYGRRRILTGFNDKYTTRINTQVQGTAGDIAKIAMAMLWDKLTRFSDGTDARLISTCHDENIMEVVEDKAEFWAMHLRQSMEDAGAVVCKRVPIIAEVGIGDTWADAK